MLQFHDALTDFLRARAIAEDTHDLDALSKTLNNLASLHLLMGKEASALEVRRAKPRWRFRKEYLTPRARHFALRRSHVAGQPGAFR